MARETDNLLIGIQAVATALKNGVNGLQRLRVVKETDNQRVKDLSLLAEDAGIAVVYETRAHLDQLSGNARHQDVIAELETSISGEAELPERLEAIEGEPFILILDGVQDPHNLGACLRTAEAAGVHVVLAPKDRSAGLTAVARKTSAGASEVIPFLQVTNLARVMRLLKERGIWIVGTDDQADQPLHERDLTGPLALVMGNEGQGMRRLTRELCDFTVHIPMAGVIESLNVSVATGVSLFEIVRQRLAGRSGSS